MLAVIDGPLAMREIAERLGYMGLAEGPRYVQIQGAVRRLRRKGRSGHEGHGRR